MLLTKDLHSVQWHYEMGSTTVRVIAESKEFESLKGVWDSLLQMCRDDNSPYLTYEWLSTWWKHFGERKRLNILLIEKEDQVIGIVPLMKAEYRIGLIKLSALESIGPPDCNYIGLTSTENKREVITAFLAYLEDELDRNKMVLRLTQVPEDCKFLDQLRRHHSQTSQNLGINARVIALAPYLSLPATWDGYFRSLSRKRREDLRRSQRALEKAHRVQFQHCTTGSLDKALNKFFDLHQERWQSVNVSGIFSNPKMKDFYRDIASQFLKKNWLHFSCLTADNEVVAAGYSFVYNRKFYDLTGARDTRYSDYSVGHLYHMYLIKDAIEKQLQEFDFLTRDEPYKFYWTKSARRYMQVIIIKKGFCLELRLKFIRAFLRIHEIRQYSLREIYSLYLIRRKEEKEKKRMGLLKKLG